MASKKPKAAACNLRPFTSISMRMVPRETSVTRAKNISIPVSTASTIFLPPSDLDGLPFSAPEAQESNRSPHPQVDNHGRPRPRQSQLELVDQQPGQSKTHAPHPRQSDQPARHDSARTAR